MVDGGSGGRGRLVGFLRIAGAYDDGEKEDEGDRIVLSMDCLCCNRRAVVICLLCGRCRFKGELGLILKQSEDSKTISNYNTHHTRRIL
jgi:hypothetical protein